MRKPFAKLRIDWTAASNQYRTKHRYALKHLIIVFRSNDSAARGIFGYKIKRPDAPVTLKTRTDRYVNRKKLLDWSMTIHILYVFFFSKYICTELYRSSRWDSELVQVVMLQIQQIIEIPLHTRQYNCYYRTRLSYSGYDRQDKCRTSRECALVQVK